MLKLLLLSKMVYKDKEKEREYYQREDVKDRKKVYKQTPKYKAQQKVYRQKHKKELKQYQEEYNSKPENKLKKKIYAKEHNSKLDVKVKIKLYRQKSNVKAYYKKYQKEYSKKNKDKIAKRMVEYRQKIEIKERDKEYNQKPEVKEKTNFRNKQRRKNDKNYAIKERVRLSFLQSLRTYSKTGKIMPKNEYLDMDAIIKKLTPFPDLSLYEVDHIIPLVMFDHDNLEQVRRAWLPSNLQWLPKEINRWKSDRLIMPMTEEQKEKLLKKLQKKRNY